MEVTERYFESLQNISTELYKRVSGELCPDGEWWFSDVMERLLRLQISRLPNITVSQEETRYPTSPAGMKAFLDVFFARHYFQVQDSMLDYMTSEEFLNLLDTHELKVLDIGCGPAVASLAIADMLSCIIRHLKEINGKSNFRKIRITYILNDAANLCLGTGQELLRSYFRCRSKYDSAISNERTFTVEKKFPLNMNQLRRINLNIGSYHMIIFSYVVNPLNEEYGLENISKDFAQLQTMCNTNGRMLIVQDQFSKALIRKLTKMIRQSCSKKVLTQKVYSKRNDNSVYTYSYYRSLFAPSKTNQKVNVA